MSQSTEEMEFSILINGTDRHMAEVFTDDAVWVERLQRQGFTPYQVKGISYFYRIPVNKIVTIRNVETKPRTEAQVAAQVAATQRLLTRNLRSTAPVYAGDSLTVTA